jgi:hypothetical protein
MIKEFKPIPKEYISIVINDILNSIVLYKIIRTNRVQISVNFLYYKEIFDTELSFKKYCKEIYGLDTDETSMVWDHIHEKYNRMSFKGDMINSRWYRITHVSDYENEYMGKGWETEYQKWVVMKNEGNKKINKNKLLRHSIF